MPRGYVLVGVRRWLRVGWGAGAGWAPLTYAANQGHQVVMSQLLAAGARPNSRTDEGSTALHWAAWGGHLAVVRLLLASGAGDCPPAPPLPHSKSRLSDVLARVPHTF